MAPTACWSNRTRGRFAEREPRPLGGPLEKVLCPGRQIVLRWAIACKGIRAFRWRLIHQPPRWRTGVSSRRGRDGTLTGEE